MSSQQTQATSKYMFHKIKQLSGWSHQDNIFLDFSHQSPKVLTASPHRHNMGQSCKSFDWLNKLLGDMKDFIFQQACVSKTKILLILVKLPYSNINCLILRGSSSVNTPIPVTRNIKSRCPWKVSMQGV